MKTGMNKRSETCGKCGKVLEKGHKCPQWKIVLRRSAKKPIPGAVYAPVYDIQRGKN